MRNRFDNQLAELNKELISMGALCENAIASAVKSLLESNTRLAASAIRIDHEIDRKEREIESMCLKLLLQQQPVASDLRLISSVLKMITDIERIGDHAENLAEQAQYMVEHGLQFSSTGAEDLKSISDSVLKSFQYAIDARQNGNMEAVRKVSQYEDDVDSQEEELREKHIERLSAGECKASAGVVFLDIISNLERVSDHAYNLAGYVKDEM